MHNLRTYLSAGKLKVKDFAKLIGISPKLASHIMTERARVSLERKILIAAAITKRLKQTISIYDIWPLTPWMPASTTRLFLIGRPSKKAA